MLADRAELFYLTSPVEARRLLKQIDSGSSTALVPHKRSGRHKASIPYDTGAEVSGSSGVGAGVSVK